MSRYYDGDYDEFAEDFPNQDAFWRANAERALKGKRGRRVLAELREALANLPEQRLISRALCTVNPDGRAPAPHPDAERHGWRNWAAEDFAEMVEEQGGGGVCAVGALLWWRKVKAGADPVEAFDQLPTLADFDGGDLSTTAALAASEANVVYSLAWQLAYRNDETFESCTPEERHRLFLAWLDEQLAVAV